MKPAEASPKVEGRWQQVAPDCDNTWLAGASAEARPGDEVDEMRHAGGLVGLKPKPAERRRPPAVKLTCRRHGGGVKPAGRDPDLAVGETVILMTPPFHPY